MFHFILTLEHTRTVIHSLDSADNKLMLNTLTRGLIKGAKATTMRLPIMRHRRQYT